jgi:hypothetical protein
MVVLQSRQAATLQEHLAAILMESAILTVLQECQTSAFLMVVVLQ